MRKLILQTQMSVDGFIADTHGTIDWLVWDWGVDWNWDDDLKEDFNSTIASVDCILLSRKMAVGGFFAHWAEAARDQDDPRFAYAKKLNDAHKVVFTKTLRKLEWPNASIASGELVDEISELKAQTGENIIAYGGATFVSSLIKAGLIDEYQLFINPTALGNGLAIFDRLDGKLDMTLFSSKAYDCGIAVLKYVADKTLAH